MGNGHSRVAAFSFLHEQQGDRFSNDHAPTEHDDVRARDVDLAFDKESLNPKRCARDKAGRVAHRELGHIERMKTIHVLARIERAHDRRFVDLFRRRRLNQHAVDFRIAIQFFDAREQFGLSCRIRQLEFHGMQSELAAHFIFRANVGARRRIIADENNRKSRSDAFGL